MLAGLRRPAKGVAKWPKTRPLENNYLPKGVVAWIRRVIYNWRWALLRILALRRGLLLQQRILQRRLAMAVQSESFIARRTESLDAEKIAGLVTKHTETVFGRIDVENIM